jgi:hypothetical protein
MQLADSLQLTKAGFWLVLSPFKTPKHARYVNKFQISEECVLRHLQSSKENLYTKQFYDADGVYIIKGL